MINRDKLRKQSTIYSSACEYLVYLLLSTPEYIFQRLDGITWHHIEANPVISSAKALIVLTQHLSNISLFPGGLVNLDGLVKLRSHANQIGAAIFRLVLAVLCNINQTVSEWSVGRPPEAGIK